ncbi:hypothetical protein [Candidatus Minimicrobia naudis]
MYIVLNHIWNITRTDQRKRMLIVDEAWQLMKYDDFANFLILISQARPQISIRFDDNHTGRGRLRLK